ncbi:MAG: carboxyl transferase domain-containing protein [Pseudomonadota bacterium]
MSWEPELEELRRREAFARELGGADKVKRQKDAGKMTVRERVEALADDGSFHEIGAIAGRADYDANGDLVHLTPSNYVFGRATLDGRRVVIGGDDFTVRGGSADATIKEKHQMAERMANELRLPLVRLVEGSGGGGSVKTIETTGRANVPAVAGWEYVVSNMSTVPNVSLGLGSVAGLGAAYMAACHYSVLVKEISALFVAGPPVVARVSEDLSKQELGGWEIHTRNGAVDHAVDTEEEAFECTRRFLSYLPSSIYDVPPRGSTHDDPARTDDKLISIVPRNIRQVYKMRRIVKSVVDEGSFFEIGERWGRSVITGLARLDGWPVAIMASDPYHYGGAWTANTCQKVTRFVDMAETFHLPVVYLVDCPGFLIGKEAEEQATIRHGVRAMSAMYQANTPWCAVIIRNSFGVAGAAHRNGSKVNYRYAWPSGRWGSLPLEGGIEAAYRADIDAADDPAAKLEEIEERLQKLRSPFRSAEAFWIEEIVDPRETRPLICEFANIAAPLREPGARTFGMRP